MAKRSKKKKVVGAGVSTKAPATDAAAPGLPTWLSRNWFLGLILVLAVILTYTPVWWAGFVWDDEGLVTANPCIIGPLGLKEIWTTSAADLCPLVLTIFWVEHALWGLAPLGYHLVNVLLHAAGAIVLWRVLRILQIPGAWLGAALWALHPVQVESVAWVSEMKNTQSGLFFLLSILFFVKGLKASDDQDRSAGRWNYALTLLFAALAMASKSSTVILPIILCLCAGWMESRWPWRTLTKVVPVFLMSIFISALTIGTFKLHANVDSLSTRSWPERLIDAGNAVWFYLGKLFWPHPLVTIYPHQEIDIGSWVSYLPLLAVPIVLLILWLKRKSWIRPYFFTFAYFLVALFPVLGLVNQSFVHYSLVADHLQYLADMGPLALVGVGLARFSDVVIPGKPWLQTPICVGLLLLLGALSWQRTMVYESEETLWMDILAKNPNCWLGHNDLGFAFLQKGHVDEAMTQFQKALEINPTYADAYYNLGLAFFQKGHVDEAIIEYQKALGIDPNYALVHSNLGLAFFQKGYVDEAIIEYKKALEIDPNYALVHNNLGNAFSHIERIGEAIVEYQKALEINPDYADAHYNLGLSFAQKGEVNEAMRQYQRALEINPSIVEARYNLGNIFFKMGQADEAIIEYQKILKINPNIAQVHNNLGSAFFQKGRVDEAMVQFQEAVRLMPDYVNAQNNLVKAKALVAQKEIRK